MSLQILDSNWNDLAHINNVPPMSEKDDALLLELRAVLEKHDAIDRFGITLLHKHFDLADDEVLVETCDEERKELTSRPIKKSEALREHTLQVGVRFSKNDPVSVGRCTWTCYRDEDGFHTKRCWP